MTDRKGRALSAGQEMFDFDALDDTRAREFYSCGKHEVRREADSHWNECRGNRCPRCEEQCSNSFTAELNHQSVEWRLLCSKQLALLDHVVRCDLQLNGEWVHAPQTNCYARSHDHSDRKSHAYFTRGCPVECIQAERDEDAEWLRASGVPDEFIGMPSQRSLAMGVPA